MTEPSGRKPDFKVKVLNKVTDERGCVGAAWKNDDGSVTILLDYCVVLPGGKDNLITLFPIDRKNQ